MASGMDFCLDNTVIDTLKKTANARKQVFLVRSVDHHLNTCFSWGDTRFYHWHRRFHPVMQMVHMPGDLLRVMLQQISCIQLCPEPFMRADRNSIESQ